MHSGPLLKFSAIVVVSAFARSPGFCRWCLGLGFKVWVVASELAVLGFALGFAPLAVRELATWPGIFMAACHSGARVSGLGPLRPLVLFGVLSCSETL